MKKQFMKILAISCVLLVFSMDASAFGGGGRRGGGRPKVGIPFLAGMELRIRALDEAFNNSLPDPTTGIQKRYRDSSVVEVRLIRFRDCSAAPGSAGKDPSPGAPQLVVFYSPTCCEAIIDTVYLDTAQSDKYATPLCPFNPAITMCVKDTPYPGYKTEVYIDTLILPCRVSDWRVGHIFNGDTTGSFRNENFLTNFQHPSGRGNARSNVTNNLGNVWDSYGGRNQTNNQPAMGYGQQINEHCVAYIEMWYDNYVEQGFTITPPFGIVPKYIANSTPLSAANPLIFQCQNQRRKYNLGYYDLDEHRLKYKSVTPYKDAPANFFNYTGFNPAGSSGFAEPCVPAAGFDLVNSPLGGAPSYYNIDSVTGEIEFIGYYLKTGTNAQKVTPIGKYKTAFGIEEFDDNGKLIGKNMRDVAITIIDPPNCDNDSLVSNFCYFYNNLYNLTNCAQVANTTGPIKTVELCAGTSNVSFQVKAYTDQYIQGASLFVGAEMPEELVAAGAKVVPGGYTSSTFNPYLVGTGVFEWNVPANMKPGIYPIVFQIRDCIDGYILARTMVVNIRVNKKAKLNWYYTGFSPSLTADYFKLPDTGVAYTCGAPNMDILLLAGSSNDKGFHTWSTPNGSTLDLNDQGPGLQFLQPIPLNHGVENTVCVKADQYCQHTACVLIKPKQPINPILDVVSPDSCFNAIVKFEIKNLPSVPGLLFDWTASNSEFASAPSPFSNTAFGKINRPNNDFTAFVISPDTCIYPLFSSIPTTGIKPRFQYGTNKINVCPFVPINTETPLMTTSICGQSQFSRPYGPILYSAYPGNESNTAATPKVFTATAGIDKMRTEFLYKATELKARGFKPGFIKEIAFSIDGISNPTFYSNVKISVRCTDKGDLGNLKFEDDNNLIPLVNEPSVNLTTGWNTFSFGTSGFTWDGETNLIFDVQSYCNVVDQGAPVPPVFNENLTTFISTIGQYGKGNKGFATAPVQGSNIRPNIRWGYQNLDESKLKYTWFDANNPSRDISSLLKSPIQSTSDPRYARYKDSVPTFVVGDPMLFGVTVRDSNCSSVGTVLADIDSNFKVRVTPHYAAKCPEDTVHVLGTVGSPVQRFINVKCGDPNPTLENPLSDSCRRSDTLFNPVFGTTSATNPGNAIHSPFGGVGAANPSITSDKHIQILLTYNELKAKMSPGFIQGITFQVVNPVQSNIASAKLSNFSVSMKCVPPSWDSIPSNNFINTAGFKQVYYGDYKPVFGLNYIKFTDTARDRFGWNDSTGIVIDICFDNITGASYNADIVACSTITGKKRYLYKASNVGTNDLGCAFTTGVRDVIRPNIGFVYCRATKPRPPIPMNLEWNPPTYISNTLIDSPILYNKFTTKYYANLQYIDTNNGGNKTVCAVRDTILVKVDRPEIEFYPLNAFSCEGTSVNVNAGVKGMNQNLYTYEWDTFVNGKMVVGLDMRRLTSPNQVITPPSDGYYYVKVFSASNPNCWNRDSVYVTIQKKKTMPDIGSSTLLCPGQTLKLSIPTNVGYMNPIWYHNNRKLDTGYSLVVTAAGDYYVEVDSGACRNVSLVKKVSYRSQDTVKLKDRNFTICEGDSATIYYDISSGVANPIWNTGSNKSFIRVNQAGEYFLVNPKDMFGCKMINKDIAYVKVIANPVFTLQDDTLCMSANEKVLLKPNPFDPSATYYWEPSGTLGSNLEVQTPNTYTVTRKIGTCTKVATAVVKNDTIGQVFLGANRAVCCDEVVTLDANPLGKRYTAYRWSNGDVGQIVYTTPNTSGNYIVEAFRSNGCRDTGSIFIDSKCTQVRATSEKKEIQLGETNVMYGRHLTVKSSKIGYQWIPSEEFNLIFDKDSLKSKARPKDTGEVEYVLVMTVEDTSYTPSKTCVENEVVRFRVKPNSVSTYNAFSPNGDGQNDIFYPTIDGIVKITDFKVYNRFGQLLHNSATVGWDGKYNGTPQPSGVYVGLVSYEFEEPKKPIVIKRKQIAITLVR